LIDLVERIRERGMQKEMRRWKRKVEN